MLNSQALRDFATKIWLQDSANLLPRLIIVGNALEAVEKGHP